jgi:hypothetical protein
MTGHWLRKMDRMVPGTDAIPIEIAAAVKVAATRDHHRLSRKSWRKFARSSPHKTCSRHRDGRPSSGVLSSYGSFFLVAVRFIGRGDDDLLHRRGTPACLQTLDQVPRMLESNVEIGLRIGDTYDSLSCNVKYGIDLVLPQDPLQTVLGLAPRREQL